MRPGRAFDSVARQDASETGLSPVTTHRAVRYVAYMPSTIYISILYGMGYGLALDVANTNGAVLYMQVV
jgi:hypothetical protein